MTDWVDIDIFGLLNGREVARLSTLYRPDYRDSWAEPPASLMRRTIFVDQTNFYWLVGLQSFSEYYKTIQRHCDIKRAKRLLDWGCGCGRMTRFFSKHIGHLEVHGCDIDTEQIEWCAANLPKARFVVIPPFPPTMYADDMFDIVISWSVFTHLRRDVQLDWLKEMRRIIAPGGLFLASVSGESLLRFASREAQLEMMKNGISDSSLDRALDGIAPEGYYRGTLQRKSYTCREYSRYFRVAEYIEQGATSSQDLIIMRKE
jgi:SAM-dependent methyltransferase